MRIELASAADVPRLLEIRHAAFTEQAPSAYASKEVATLLGDVDPAELGSMIMEAQLFVACLDQGRPGGDRAIVGLAGWRGDRLRHVYVCPAYGRKGFATALVRHVENDFHARTGRGAIRAGVALHARGFYLTIGYRVVRRAVAWDGSGYLEMVRDLER